MAENASIYQDIATRTGGDIYIGVVGPVRTGKSTFIKRFMETLVLPQMEETPAKERAKDEMPQSGSGKNVMTTEPKFVPDEAVKIQMENSLSFRVKLVDCVGFPVPEAGGLEEDGNIRMVNTPWSETPLPFEEAAVLGTRKVMWEHSTIGIVITTDGSIGQIPRDHYQEAEKKVIQEMKTTGKPFAVILNSQHPSTDETQNLATLLQAKYQVPVIPMNCFAMEEKDFVYILKQIVLEFPIREIKISLPSWIISLESKHPFKKDIVDCIISSLETIKKTGEYYSALKKIAQCEQILSAVTLESDLGTGLIRADVKPAEQLFWDVLSQESGMDIHSESELIYEFAKMSEKRLRYEKISQALQDAEESGYGIVTPELQDLTLEEPEIVKQSGGYGVKLKASAPSIHMIRANIQAEISPIVGSERQSEDIVKFLLKEFEEDPTQIWQSNMFGKSLYELVNEGLNTKLNHMPQEARQKLGETLQKIINEGSGGLICIIL